MSQNPERPEDLKLDPTHTDFHGEAEALWNVYREGAGGIAYNGEALGEFDTLPTRSQNGWRAVAEYVFGEVVDEDSSSNVND